MKKEFIILTTIGLLVVVGAFYWFAYRPVQIKKSCNVKAKNIHDQWYWANGGEYDDQSNNAYYECLRENGI